MFHAHRASESQWLVFGFGRVVSTHGYEADAIRRAEFLNRTLGTPHDGHEAERLERKSREEAIIDRAEWFDMG